MEGEKKGSPINSGVIRGLAQTGETQMCMSGFGRGRQEGMTRVGVFGSFPLQTCWDVA